MVVSVARFLNTAKVADVVSLRYLKRHTVKSNQHGAKATTGFVAPFGTFDLGMAAPYKKKVKGVLGSIS